LTSLQLTLVTKSCVIGSNASSGSHHGSHRSMSDSTARRPTHGLGSRHEVVLKPLPFYDVLAEIMKPSSLGMMSAQISFLTTDVLCAVQEYKDMCSIVCNSILYGFIKCQFV